MFLENLHIWISPKLLNKWFEIVPFTVFIELGPQLFAMYCMEFHIKQIISPY